MDAAALLIQHQSRKLVLAVENVTSSSPSDIAVWRRAGCVPCGGSLLRDLPGLKGDPSCLLSLGGKAHQGAGGFSVLWECLAGLPSMTTRSLCKPSSCCLELCGVENLAALGAVPYPFLLPSELLRCFGGRTRKTLTERDEVCVRAFWEAAETSFKSLFGIWSSSLLLKSPFLIIKQRRFGSERA